MFAGISLDQAGLLGDAVELYQQALAVAGSDKAYATSLCISALGRSAKQLFIEEKCVEASSDVQAEYKPRYDRAGQLIRQALAFNVDEKRASLLLDLSAVEVDCRLCMFA